METYSFSKIRRFYDCPWSFYKHYILDEQRDEPHGTSQFGSFCHSILEKYAKKELSADETLEYYVKNYASNVSAPFKLYFSDTFSKDLKDNYFDSGYNYFYHFHGFDGWTILEAEYDFTENMDNKFYFTGKIDLIAKDKDDNIIICDHKSKSKFNSKKERAEYARQLYLYAYAVYQKYHKFPKQIAFNMFRTDTMVVMDFNEEDYQETLQWLYNSVLEIETCFDFYAQNGTFYCRNFCDFRYDNDEMCRGDKV